MSAGSRANERPAWVLRYQALQIYTGFIPIPYVIAYNLEMEANWRTITSKPTTNDYVNTPTKVRAANIR